MRWARAAFVTLCLVQVGCNGASDESDTISGGEPCRKIVTSKQEACSAKSAAANACNNCVAAAVPTAKAVTCACWELGDDCYVGSPPDETTNVPPRPAPDPECCDLKLSFHPEGDASGVPTTKPTLELELGTWDHCAQRFLPYKDHQWTELATAGQGLFHVHASVRVKLPGRTGKHANVQFVAAGLDGCAPAASGFIGQLQLKPDPEKADWWTYRQGKRPGVFVIFKPEACQACRYCGHWVDLRVAVRDNTNGAWGEASVVLRTYMESIHPDCLKIAKCGPP